MRSMWIRVSETLIEVKSVILYGPSLTANASGLNLLPAHVLQGTNSKYFSNFCLTDSPLASFSCLSNIGKIPSKVFQNHWKF